MKEPDAIAQGKLPHGNAVVIAPVLSVTRLQTNKGVNICRVHQRAQLRGAHPACGLPTQKVGKDPAGFKVVGHS